MLALAACGGGDGDDAANVDATRADGAPAIDAAPQYVPGDPMVISTGSTMNDEDPFLLRARDGSIYVAWFSETVGNDILISRTTDGVTWTPPAHISSGPAVDYAPSLYQDAAGIIHATWFRMAPGRIVYNRTAAADDGLVWGAGGEVDVTTGVGTDDWVPSIAPAPGGGLAIAFTRNTCPPPDTCWGIASATSADGATWSGVTPVVPAAGGFEHHLPQLANIDGELQLAWVPYDADAAVPWESGSSGAHVRMLHSATGATWDDPRTVAARDEAAVALFPTLYADHAGRWFVAWLGAAATGSGVVELPLDAIGSGTPAPLPIPGYSPRVVATPTPGVFVAAWVEGPPNDRDIHVRVFAKN